MTPSTLSFLCLAVNVFSILTKAWNSRCSLTVRVPMKRSSCWMYAETEVRELGVTATPLT